MYVCLFVRMSIPIYMYTYKQYMYKYINIYTYIYIYSYLYVGACALCFQDFHGGFQVAARRIGALESPEPRAHLTAGSAQRSKTTPYIQILRSRYIDMCNIYIYTQLYIQMYVQTMCICKYVFLCVYIHTHFTHVIHMHPKLEGVGCRLVLFGIYVAPNCVVAFLILVVGGLEN